MPYVGDGEDLIERCLAELNARVIEYEKAANYYDGKHGKTHRDDDDNYVVNRFRMNIDAIVNFVAPQFPLIQSDNLPANSALSLAWDNSGQLNILHDLLMYGSLAGQVYLWVDASGFTPINPKVIVPIWGQTYNDILGYFIIRESDLVEIYYPDRMEAYKLVNRKWSLISTTVVEARIVTWQHKRNARSFYGEDYNDALPLQDALNRVMSDAMIIMKTFARPTYVFKNMSNQIVTQIPTNDALVLPDGADFTVIDPKADINQSVQLIKLLTVDLNSIMGVVDIGDDLSALNNVTNNGLRLAYQRMVQHTRGIKALYSQGLRDACYAFLEIIGYRDLNGIEISVTIPDALPENKLETLSYIKELLDLGLIDQAQAKAILNLKEQ